MTATTQPTAPTAARSRFASRTYRATAYGRQVIHHLNCQEDRHPFIPIEAIARATVHHRGFGTHLNVKTTAPFLQNPHKIVSAAEAAAWAFHNKFTTPGDLRISLWFSAGTITEATLEATAVAVIRAFAEAAEVVVTDQQLVDLVQTLGFSGASALNGAGYITATGEVKPQDDDLDPAGHLLVLQPQNVDCTPADTPNEAFDILSQTLTNHDGLNTQIRGSAHSTSAPLVAYLPNGSANQAPPSQLAVQLRTTLGEDWDVLVTQPAYH